MNTSRPKGSIPSALRARISGAEICFWWRCLPDGVIMSVYLTRLMSTAEGQLGDSEAVAVVSLCLHLLIPGPVGITDCYLCTCASSAHCNLH